MEMREWGIGNKEMGMGMGMGKRKWGLRGIGLFDACLDLKNSV